MKRIMVILTIVTVLVAMAATAGPVLAQTDDKAAKRAAKRAVKQAQKAQNPAPAKGGVQKAVPADAGAQQKALPASGGPVVDLGLLGAGVLLVGGGLVAARVARR